MLLHHQWSEYCSDTGDGDTRTTIVRLARDDTVLFYDNRLVAVQRLSTTCVQAVNVGRSHVSKIGVTILHPTTAEENKSEWESVL